MSCPSPPSRKAPGLPFLSGFPGVFLFSRVDCPPRRAAADVRPPAAPGHKKRRRPPSTPSRSMNVRMCGPFPPEICPFPLKNGGFPTLPPVLPVYPGFSIILSPYTLPPGRSACQNKRSRLFCFLSFAVTRNCAVLAVCRWLPAHASLPHMSIILRPGPDTPPGRRPAGRFPPPLPSLRSGNAKAHR